MKKNLKKEILIYRSLRFSVIVFSLIILPILGANVNQNLNILDEVYAQPACNCTTGSSSNQGCAALGCPAGTRRMCGCGDQSGDGLCEVQGNQPPKNGLWECGCIPDPSCPVDTNPDPGGGGDPTCTFTAWGPCSVSCGTGTQTDNCGNVRACSAGSCCTPQTPAAPTLNTPAAGQILTTTTVGFGWAETDWGVGCPDYRSHALWVYGGTCAAGASDTDVSTSGVIDGSWFKLYEDGGTLFTYNWAGAQRGKTYCWLVHKRNNLSDIASALRQFSVSPAAPTVTPVCSAGLSRANISWVLNNPMSNSGHRVDISTVSNFASFWSLNVGAATSSVSNAPNGFTGAPAGLTPGTTYYARVRYSNLTNSQTTTFVAPDCAAPVVTYTCSAGVANATIDWTRTDPSGYIVDISRTNFGQFWNKNVPSGTTITTAPSGFNPYAPSGASGGLTLTNGQYYTRIYYVGAAEHSAVAPFTVSCPVCGNGTIETGETCDNGASNGSVCTPTGSAGATCNYCTNACQTATVTAPIGYLDNANCTQVWGWSCDPQDFNRTVGVNVYSQNTSGGPLVLINSGGANTSRPDAAGVCGGNPNHGYSFTLPPSFIDGQTKNIFAYGTNTSGNQYLLTDPPPPVQVNTLNCITPPTVSFAAPTNDTCGTGYSGRSTSIDPAVTNPMQFRVSAQDAGGRLSRIELYLVPRNAADGHPNNVFENSANPTKDTVVTKVQQTEAIAISYDVATNQYWTLNSSGTWINRSNNVSVGTYRATVNANKTGTTSNATVDFTITFNNNFYNGLYSVYYTAINNPGNATPANPPTLDTSQIRLLRYGDWGIDMDPPNVILSDPTFILNSTYSITRTAGESTLVNQSGLNPAKHRAYFYTLNANAQYQYRISSNPSYQPLNILYQNPTTTYPAIPSNLDATLNGTFVFEDLQNELEIPVNHALYVADNACNVSVATKNVAAMGLETPWLMTVGGSVSAGEGIDSGISIPVNELSIPGVYTGDAAISTETVITGNNNIPQNDLSTRGNVITQYLDDAISVPGQANYDNWYDHILDRIQRNQGISLGSKGDGVIEEFSSEIVALGNADNSDSKPQDNVLASDNTQERLETKNVLSQLAKPLSITNLEKIFELDSLTQKVDLTQCTIIAPTPASLISPFNGQSFSTTSIGFSWTTNSWGSGCPNVLVQALWIYGGTCAAGQNDFDISTSGVVDGAWFKLYENGGSPSSYTWNGAQQGKTYCWNINKRNNTQTVSSAFWQFTVQRLCYSCTASTSDGNTCQGGWYTGSSCPAGTSTSPSGCAAAVGGSCPSQVTCYTCTTSTSDGNTCQSGTYSGTSCPAGTSSSSTGCAAAVGGSCPAQVTCYTCTASTTDGNTCQSGTYSGSSCPAGTSTSPSGCAAAVGGSCPVQSFCYTCTTSTTDGNTCQGAWYSGGSCPSGTSSSPTGCAAAVGGTCTAQLTCYQCTTSLTDGNTCQSFIHTGTACPAGSSSSSTGCAASVGGSCPAQVTCSQCTTSTSDQGACLNQTFDSGSCPAGWSPGNNSCNSCPSQIACSRCTISTADGANVCENSTFSVSSDNYTCPPGWVPGTNSCGSSCPVEKTCYECTASTSDGNACRTFVHSGSTCPAGSSENSNCAQNAGGACPVITNCYRCTDSTSDGNTCEQFSHPGSTCPSGTSPNPTGCAGSAPGGSCQSVITCYKCTDNPYDSNVCEPFVHAGLTCPTGTSPNAAGCAGVSTGGMCPGPEARDQILPVMYNNLTIKSGATCDNQAIIFVQGNLTIEPDFTNRHTQNGCIFVVKGDVIVENGNQKTGAPIFAATPAEYDIIEGYFIVNGTFRTQLDNAVGDFDKWDGLMIKGGVYARQLDLKRNMNGNGNGNISRPAHLFVHDARYKQIYENSLGSRFYSIRENN